MDERIDRTNRSPTIDGRSIDAACCFGHLVTTTGTALTCVVADDDPAVADALDDLLTRLGHHVVALCAIGDAALAAIDKHHPDIAILDYSMPGATGIEIARRTSTDRSRTALVLYTATDEHAIVEDALDAGIRGIVAKGASLAELLDAIGLAAAGKTYISPVLSLAGKGPCLSQRREDRARMRYRQQQARLVLLNLRVSYLGGGYEPAPWGSRRVRFGLNKPFRVG